MTHHKVRGLYPITISFKIHYVRFKNSSELDIRLLANSRQCHFLCIGVFKLMLSNWPYKQMKMPGFSEFPPLMGDENRDTLLDPKQ